MCEDRQYPPRYILEVDSHRATENVTAKVTFPGAKEYFKRATPSSDIKLTFYPQGYLYVWFVLVLKLSYRCSS